MPAAYGFGVSGYEITLERNWTGLWYNAAIEHVHSRVTGPASSASHRTTLATYRGRDIEALGRRVGNDLPGTVDEDRYERIRDDAERYVHADLEDAAIEPFMDGLEQVLDRERG